MDIKTNNDGRFTSLGSPKRIWAVSAIHSVIDKLIPLHDSILEHIKPGDRLVYLGNYTGYGEQAVECIDEILTFRRLVLSIPGIMCKDIVYLRGAQEEMWQKLLQLQFAPNPSDVLLWMLGNGLSSTLQNYGICPHDGIEACHSGVMGLTKWTNSIRDAIRAHPGHDTFGAQLTRAAHTDKNSEAPILFVHAGLDEHKPLTEQGDCLWWAGKHFDAISEPYEPFQKVIRGYDPDHGGVNMNCVTATIDGGCGFGGPLVGAGFDSYGNVLEMVEA